MSALLGCFVALLAAMGLLVWGCMVVAGWADHEMHRRQRARAGRDVVGVRHGTDGI